MARLTSSTTLEYLSELYAALCITCFAKVRYPETIQYINKLEEAICLAVSDNDYISDIKYLKELDEELPNQQGDRLTYKYKSPFGRHFHDIYQKSSNFTRNLSIKYSHHSFEENTEYYLPDLPGFLATHYIQVSILMDIVTSELPTYNLVNQLSNL